MLRLLIYALNVLSQPCCYCALGSRDCSVSVWVRIYSRKEFTQFHNFDPSFFTVLVNSASTTAGCN